MNNGRTVIVLAGPTAVGKTSHAIRLAKYLSTEIISADSRQCYKELDIGVARPSAASLQEVQHHFIASHSIEQSVTAATFEQYALEKTNSIFKDHDQLVMVGGTGLYIKAFCEGLDAIPEINPSVRQQIIEGYEKNGLSWLQEEIRVNDPAFFEKGEKMNPQRMMRALEVVISTGHSIFSFRNMGKKKRDFQIIKIGLGLEKKLLLHNIHTRVDQMMDAGLLGEVKRLVPYRSLNALQTVGYVEIFDYLDRNGNEDGDSAGLKTAVEQIKTNTWQYAKRQMTWFRKDKEIKWVAPGEDNLIKEYLGL
jgi:tRNA dimethylallyltransferase